MAATRRKGTRRPFPWIPLLLLLLTLGLFWVLPRKLGAPPVKVEFEGGKPSVTKP